ncbi:hypothetical protein [Leptolyngbya sp. 7M]|uniref:hypothetical protein n=1 Tax=Leptolyngbya sp. 7M TaxID=2812896 RepID=UPI001B8BFCEB|nr:hypothetical protein [Leptolyngbya sp. 7M]QYO62618.1 hypothetical protein JVX88_21510 [Leptolyngbya sp. 7M]
MHPTNTILEKVKGFLIRLVKDSAFVNQLQTSSIDQIQSLLHQSGYTFTNAEFETATIQLLDLKERDEFHELTEDELVGAIGGWMRRYPYPRPCHTPCSNPYPIQPMYGVIVEPPSDGYPRPKPKPLPYPYPQPMYGVVISPPGEVQPMYGVVIAPEDA